MGDHNPAFNKGVAIIDMSDALRSTSSSDFSSADRGSRGSESGATTSATPSHGARASRTYRMGGEIMDMQVTPAKAHLRRNGKMGSCEPCRAVKLRCDHQLPVCGRCAKKGYVGKCQYIANPKSSRQSLPKAVKPTARPSPSGTSNTIPHFEKSASPSLSLPSASFKPAEQTVLSPIPRPMPPPRRSFTPININNTILNSVERPLAPAPSSFAPSNSTNLTWSTVDASDFENDAVSIPKPTGNFRPQNQYHVGISLDDGNHRSLASPAPDSFGPNSRHDRPPIPSRTQRCNSAPPLDIHAELVVGANAGFVGATSFASILSEGLGKLHAPEICNAELEPPKIEGIPISHKLIMEGAEIFSFLKDWHLVIQFMRRFNEITHDSSGLFVPAIMKEWVKQLQTFHGEAISSQNPDKMRKLSALVWKNTQTPLVYDGKTTAIEWARLSTGSNIRWEVIGLIAAQLGQCALCLAPTDKLFQTHRVDSISFTKRMAEITESCIAFSRKCHILPDTFIWLLLERASSLSALHGERNFDTYRATGETNDAVIEMGLHQRIRDDGKTPIFLREFRKRIMMFAYGTEISVALFLGRPPRLSYRYCHLDPPLDLTENQLALEGAELEAALANIDDQGFNKNQRVQRMTWVRTWPVFGAMREDILDLSLGTYSQSEILARAEAIIAKSEAYWATLPPFVQRVRSDRVDLMTPPLIDALFLQAMRQGTRTNELVLQRLLIRRASASPAELLRIARIMFADVLQITTRHDFATTLRADFTAMLVNHGLRCGAILAVELLKQEQMPEYPRDPLLPRSQTVQDLSVFAARLAQVDPADGSYDACEQGRKVITMILDRILSPPPNARRTHGLATECHPPEAREEAVAAEQQPQDQRQEQVDVDMGEVPQQLGGLEDGALAASRLFDVTGSGGLAFGGENPMTFDNDDFMQWLENVDFESPEAWTSMCDAAASGYRVVRV